MHTTRSTILLISLLVLSCQVVDQGESTKPSASNEGEIVTTLPLSAYHPVSTYQLPVTHISKARYPAIDLHTHPYPKSRSEIEQWVETMDLSGIEKSVLLTYSTGTRFDSLYDLYSGYGDRFILFCGFDYTGYDTPGYGPAAVAELERCVRKGARGVGELGDKGKGLFYSNPTKAYGMHIDYRRMDPLIKKCADLDIPISIHVAEPIWMYLPMDETNDGLMNAFKWRLDNQPGILGHEAMLKTLSNAAAKHPQTTFIACHYANCSYDLDLLGDLFDQHPNLYADISARFGETAPIPRKVNTFFSKYQNRLVYGTDMGTAANMYAITFRILESEDEHFYDREHFNYHWPLHGYGLDDEVLKKVYQTNAEEILFPGDGP